MRVEGEIAPPGDKSITIRALMLAAIARGRSEIHEPLGAGDTRSTAAVLRRLGVDVAPVRHGRTVRVRGRPWCVPPQTLHCGNSGTTARLILGMLAAHPFTSRLTGDASLRGRPMRRVTKPLIQMGATIVEERGDRLPIRITGGELQRVRYQMPVASAQVKSAILLAGALSGAGVTVIEPYRSRDHTERLFRYLGIQVRTTDTTITIPAGDFRPNAFELSVPGDPSSAAFFVAAAVLADHGMLAIRRVGINPTRTGFLQVLRRMGAAVSVESVHDVAGEPVADLVVEPATLRATVVQATEVPSLIDEVPILAIVAAHARGVTRFHGVGELRVKESDRLGLIADNLRRVGYEVEVSGDTLAIHGDPDHVPRGRVATGNDHRIAMAFGILGTTDGARVRLSEQDSTGVSFPGFFAQLERLILRS